MSNRWQRFISRFFPQETELLASVDAAEEGDALAVRLAVPEGDGDAAVTAIDLARGRVRTRAGHRRLSDRARKIAGALAADAGATLRPNRDGTLAVDERRLPETLRDLRALADDDDDAISETPAARAIKLADKRPLQYEFQVAFTGDDELTVAPQVVSADGKVRLHPDALNLPPPPPRRRLRGRDRSRDRDRALAFQGQDRSLSTQGQDRSSGQDQGAPGQDRSPAPERARWVRQGKTYYPAPVETPSEIAAFAARAVALRGDDIPFFLARQLKLLGRAGRVAATDEIKTARVAADALEPVSVLDLDDEGFLRVEVAYRGAGLTISQAEIDALPADARYVRRGNQWAPIDRRAQHRVTDALGQVERKLGARRDGAGRLRVTPGQGDEARRVLLTAGEIDEGAAFQKFLADLAGFRTIDPLPPPAGIQVTLRPYQVEGFRWLAFLRKYYLNGVLADDMGLGKTAQLLTLLQHAKDHPDAERPDPTLIVCPTSCVENWIDEARKFAPDLVFARYAGNDRARALSDAPDVLVTTYETLRRDLGDLQAQSWDYVILDEAQKVKNPITETARACRQLLARHRLAVTGTPIENRLDELWAIFDFLMPGYLGTQARFRRDFDGPITRDKSVGAADELKRKIAPFVLRRMKEQVARDLPPKLYVTRECRLTREQSSLYARVAGEGRERVLEAARRGDGEHVAMTMHILAALTQLKQICCHPALLDADLETTELDGRSGKFEAFKEVLVERLEAGDKVLVFSQYAGMCHLLARHLRQAGIPALLLDGQTRHRQDLVRTFQSDPAIKVFVLSLRAAGFGITLTAASSVIHYDRWWNPAVENQATDRAYRIGQKRSVQVVQFQTEDTIEEKIDRLLTSKSQLFGDVIEADLNGKTISRDELLDLFAFSPLRDAATEDNLPAITHDTRPYAPDAVAAARPDGAGVAIPDGAGGRVVKGARSWP